jgi:hypothetical protein
MGRKTIIVLSSVAIILSIASICIAIVRCEPIEANWMAILVGILSLLTASLIGWQIIRAYGLERTIRRIDNIVNDRTLVVAQDINRIITAFEHRMSSRRPVIQPESQEKSLEFLIMALEEVQKIETPNANRKSIDKIMADILELSELYKDSPKLSKVEQERYLSVVKRVEHKDTITVINYISHACS